MITRLSFTSPVRPFPVINQLSIDSPERAKQIDPPEGRENGRFHSLPELSYGSQDLASKFHAAGEPTPKSLSNQIRNKCNERLEECKKGTRTRREFGSSG